MVVGVGVELSLSLRWSLEGKSLGMWGQVKSADGTNLLSSAKIPATPVDNKALARIRRRRVNSDPISEYKSTNTCLITPPLGALCAPIIPACPRPLRSDYPTCPRPLRSDYPPVRALCALIIPACPRLLRSDYPRLSAPWLSRLSAPSALWLSPPWLSSQLVRVPAPPR